MRVGDIMAVDVPTIEPSASISEAAARMKSENSRSLFVTSEGRLIGLITDSDILWLIANGGDPLKRRVWELMSATLPSASPEADISELVHLMNRHGVRWVAVVEDGQLVGAVSVANVVASLELT